MTALGLWRLLCNCKYLLLYYQAKFVFCVLLVRIYSKPKPKWWCPRDSLKQATSTSLWMIAGCPIKGMTTGNCSQIPRDFPQGWRLSETMWASDTILLPQKSYISHKLQIHGLGLKFGIYEDYGNFTCGGYPGVLGHLETDAKTLASWGADYIKLDGCYADLNDMEQGEQFLKC